MDTEHKLTKIREKCVEFLAIAEKRTQGRWIKEKERNNTLFVMSGQGAVLWIDSANEQEESAIDFIAACAGPAEAGWKSTIAAIDDCICVDETQPEDVQKIARDMMIECNQVMVDRIIAAWEGLIK